MNKGHADTNDMQTQTDRQAGRQAGRRVQTDKQAERQTQQTTSRSIKGCQGAALQAWVHTGLVRHGNLQSGKDLNWTHTHVKPTAHVICFKETRAMGNTID